MGDLKGQVWLITGASAGFGRCLSDEILARGGIVVATARNPATVQDIVAKAPDRVLGVALDVTKPDQIAAAIAATKARFGRLDVLVNNAGYGFLSGVEEAGDQEIRDLFEVNFFGLVATTQAALEVMRAQRSGMIVNFSSSAGVRGHPGSAYYCASKWAVEGFTESLAYEGAPLGINALIVEPGPFRTDFAGRSIAAPAREIPDYELAVATRKGLAQSDGKQAGDPVRAATFIVDTVLQKDRPMRLVLGRATFDSVCKSIQARLDDTRRSKDAAYAADFPAEDLA